MLLLWRVCSNTHFLSIIPLVIGSGASSFNQPIGNWNVSSVTNMIGLFSGVTLSIVNYDNLLAGWARLSLQTGIDFDGGNSHYSCTTARQHIIDTFGWTITDGGLATTSSEIIGICENLFDTSGTSNSNFLQISVFLVSIVSIEIFKEKRKNRI